MCDWVQVCTARTPACQQPIRNYPLYPYPSPYIFIFLPYPLTSLYSYPIPLHPYPLPLHPYPTPYILTLPITLLRMSRTYPIHAAPPRPAVENVPEYVVIAADVERLPTEGIAIAHT